MTPLKSFLIALTLAGAVASAVDRPVVSAQRPATRAHVEQLTTDRMDGRAAGSAGAKLAAEYLVEQLTRIGARPLPGQKDFRLPFQFTGGVKDGGSAIMLKAANGETQRWAGVDVVQGLSFSDTGRVSGPIVFAGYGLVVPVTASFSYDSYGALDVKDKIVVVLRYYPEEADEEIKTLLARYSGLRYKAIAARDRGAKGLVVVTGPRSPNAGAVVPMTVDAAVAGSGMVAASAGGPFADLLFKQVSGRPLEEVQKALDTGNPHVPGFDIPGELTLDIKVNRERRTDYNVVAYLPPAQNGDSITRPYVVLGAHYDHLGRGAHGSSLARREETGSVHRGADDNASGVAAVLAAGARLATLKRDRGIVLAFWSGEELGLLGSANFTRGPPVPIDQIAAYVNLDMVGRMRDNKLAVQAAGTSSA
ncbi:MAG: M20/M25/M40 family metallo-hydrolase, partial [Acidobacteria bacterium]|nr:M20/M25/M40 family metallo-hydrolase [Acidobacteriota bacterium]